MRFATAPDFTQKPLESRRDGICVEKRDLTDLSPVGAETFVERLFQNTSKTPKLTPMASSLITLTGLLLFDRKDK